MFLTTGGLMEEKDCCCGECEFPETPETMPRLDRLLWIAAVIVLAWFIVS